MMVQTRLRAPTYIQRSVHVLFRIVHDADELVPVVHFLKGELFHRRAGDDHAVERAVAHLRKRLIETLKMLRRGIFGFVPLSPQKRHVHLQGRIAEQAQQLRFRGDLGRHQVNDGNLQRPDVLTVGAAFRHDKNVFAFQYRAGRQIFRNLNGHGKHSFAAIKVRRLPYSIDMDSVKPGNRSPISTLFAKLGNPVTHPP